MTTEGFEPTGIKGEAKRFSDDLKAVADEIRMEERLKTLAEVGKVVVKMKFLNRPCAVCPDCGRNYKRGRGYCYAHGGNKVMLRNVDFTPEREAWNTALNAILAKLKEMKG